MSQKAQLPSLTGHRLKTRKRGKQYKPRFLFLLVSSIIFYDYPNCIKPFEKLIFFTDEKKQYDPVGFRDSIIEGLDVSNQCSYVFYAISIYHLIK